MTYTTLFFDLDNTLYSPDSGVWEAIGERINLYLIENMGLPSDEIHAIRESFYKTYGTTMRGLQVLYKIDPRDYLDFVHDIPIKSYLQPDLTTRQVIMNYALRRIIFTNADHNHARRVLDALSLEDLFPEIIDVLDIAPYCKPQPEAFLSALSIAGNLKAGECILIDDQLTNLSTAQKLGFYTIGVGCEENINGLNAGIRTIVDLPMVLDSLLS